MTFEVLLVLSLMMLIGLMSFQVQESLSHQIELQLFVAQVRSKLALAQNEAIVTQREQQVSIDMMQLQLSSSVQNDRVIAIGERIVGTSAVIRFAGGSGQVKQFQTLHYETAKQQVTIALQFGKGASYVSINAK